MPVANKETDARQRRVKRNALWLGLLAVGFYVGFILLSVSRAHG